MLSLLSPSLEITGTFPEEFDGICLPRGTIGTEGHMVP